MKLFLQLGKFWSRTSLLGRFVMAGSVVLLVSMIVTGSWVADRIAHGVIRQSGVNSALLVDSIFAPLSQELASADELSPGAVRALEELLAAPPLSDRVVSLRIWKSGGRVIFATDPELIGKTFEPSASLLAALSGRVGTEFNTLTGAESVAEKALGRPLVEIYAPVRAVWSGEVIAVYEFYETADTLRDEIRSAQRTSWLLVAAITLATGASLFGVVGSGSRTIERQRSQLQSQIHQLESLSNANRDLRVKVQRASAGAAETNERYLSRIGADLHDGPLQLLSLAALRLDSLEGEKDARKRAGELAEMRDALRSAMADIRGISRGALLPELAGLTLSRLIRRAVDGHTSLTRTDVEIDLPQIPVHLPRSQAIAVYRFVQEGLSNATRHAEGKDMRVSAARLADGRVLVEVSDGGPGLQDRAGGGEGLGLRGLADRIESLGGDFELKSGPGGGVTISLILDPEGETGRAD